MSPPEGEGFGAGFADSSGFAGAEAAGFEDATGFEPPAAGIGFAGCAAVADAGAETDADAETDAETDATGAALTAADGVAEGGGASFALAVLAVEPDVPFWLGPRPIPSAMTPAATAARATMPPIIFPLFFFVGSASAGTALPASLRASDGSGVA